MSSLRFSYSSQYHVSRHGLAINEHTEWCGDAAWTWLLLKESCAKCKTGSLNGRSLLCSLLFYNFSASIYCLTNCCPSSLCPHCRTGLTLKNALWRLTSAPSGPSFVLMSVASIEKRFLRQMASIYRNQVLVSRSAFTEPLRVILSFH